MRIVFFGTPQYVLPIVKTLHRTFKDKFRYANVSGPSAKHNIQKVGFEHILKDGDILTIVVTK